MQWDWIDAVGDYARNLATHAACADLVVIGGSAVSRRQRSLVTDLVGRVRALLVVAKTGAEGLDTDGPALVAWDGSAPVAAALRQAVPLLALASSVSILTIGSVAEEYPEDEAALYLSRHGIRADLRHIPPREDIASTILAEAEEIGAAYCLAGAYKHRPLTEAVFGGVTRSLLAQTDRTLILGH